MLPSILIFIIDVAAALTGGMMLLRFWIYAARVHPPMQIASFIYVFSNWLVNPLRKIIPSTIQEWPSLLGSILIAIVASIVKILVLFGTFNLKAALILTLLTLFNWVIYGLMGLLILLVIFSWVNPHAPLAPLVNALTRPILNPIRKIIPSIGGLDLSVLVVFLILGAAGRIIPDLILRL